MFYRLLLSLLLIINSSAYAFIENNVLHVGVNGFQPPFVMRTGKNQYNGFDINLMLYVCKSLKRTCKFHPMFFDDLLPAVQIGKIDAALSALTITYDRSRKVNFSNPYLPSMSRFLSLSNFKDKKVNKKFLYGKNIGIRKGTIFDAQLTKLKLKKINVIRFTTDNQLIDALNQKNIDLILTDNATALYWQNHSSNQIYAIGKPIKYGIGYGIATNLKELELNKQINKILNDYHQSIQYRADYQAFIETF